MTRQFPNQGEVDQWLASHCLDEADANASPVFDQLKAATADSVNQFLAAAPGIVSAGLGQWAALNIVDHDRTGIRGAGRQVTAAESIGILSRCPHTQQIRPLLLICDPPIIVYTGCLPSRKAAIEALGHRWNHQCDRCGVHVQQLMPVTLGGLGYITVSGHVCRRCPDEDRRLAAQHVDQVVMVGRTGIPRAGGRGGGPK
jgi:hypothetical protein